MSVQYNHNTTPQPVGDLIINLPVDNNTPSSSEIQLMNTLFEKHRGTINIVAEESKESLIIAIIVILFSLPQINEIITKLSPIDSEYINLLIKGVSAGVLFWLIKHFYLSKK